MNPFSRKAKLANEMAHQQSYSAEPYREGMDYTDEAWAYGLRALPGSLANQLQALGEYTTGKDYPNKLGNYLNELTQVNEMGYTPQTEYEAGVAFLPELVYDPAIIAGAPYAAYKGLRNAPRLANVIADEAGRTGMRNQLGNLTFGEVPTDAARWYGGKLPNQMTEDEFVSLHKTGWIEPGAYKETTKPYAMQKLYGGPVVEPLKDLPSEYMPISDRGKYFIGYSEGASARPAFHGKFDTEEEAINNALKNINTERGVGKSKLEKYPDLVDTITGKDGKTYEVRKTGEKNRYTKLDENGWPVYDEEGKALMMTDDEVIDSGRPLYDQGVTVFDGDRPVAISSNEFGAVGVWTDDDYQGKGIGSEILSRFLAENPSYRIGQMTDAGENMTRSAYRKLSNLLERNGEPLGNLGAFKSQLGAVDTPRGLLDSDWYHGTDKTFDVFDTSDKSSDFTIPNNLGDNIGAFFSAQKSDAKDFGKNVLKRKLNLSNPKIFESQEDFRDFMKANIGLSDDIRDADGYITKEGEPYYNTRKVLEWMGHDGVIIKKPGYNKKSDKPWAIAFNQGQIKK